MGSVTRKHIWNQVRRAIRRANDMALKVAEKYGMKFIACRDTIEFKVAVANEMRLKGCHLHLPEFTVENVKNLEK